MTLTQYTKRLLNTFKDQTCDRYDGHSIYNMFQIMSGSAEDFVYFHNGTSHFMCWSGKDARDLVEHALATDPYFLYAWRIDGKDEIRKTRW